MYSVSLVVYSPSSLFFNVLCSYVFNNLVYLLTCIHLATPCCPWDSKRCRLLYWPLHPWRPAWHSCTAYSNLFCLCRRSLQDPNNRFQKQLFPGYCIHFSARQECFWIPMEPPLRIQLIEWLKQCIGLLLLKWNWQLLISTIYNPAGNKLMLVFTDFYKNVNNYWWLKRINKVILVFSIFVNLYG